MKKTIIVTAVLILTIASFFIFADRSETAPALVEGDQDTKRKNLEQSPDEEIRAVSHNQEAVTGSEISKQRRRLAKAKVESEKEGGVVIELSVTAGIRYGETLVTGGYLNERGNHEITFVTPQKVMKGGVPKIVASATSIEMGPDFVGSGEMQDAVNNLKSIFENAQAWTSDHAKEVIQLASTTAKGDRPAVAMIGLLASPTIMTGFDQSAQVAYGGDDGWMSSIQLVFHEGSPGEVIVESTLKRSLAEK